MSDTQELQARIARALDRIGSGADMLDAARTEAEAARSETRAEAAKALSEAEARATRAESDLAALRQEIATLEQAVAEAAQQQKPPEDAADPEELATLRAELEDERTAYAQLEERLRSLKARQVDETASLQDQLAGQRETFGQLDAELQRLRAANTQLEQTCAALREANEQGLGDPELVDAALRAELESLHAARAVETAETRAILEAIEPILAQAVGAGDAAAGDTPGTEEEHAT